MRTGKLTAMGIKRLTKAGRYGDGGNLYFNVRANGSRAWLLRYKLPGQKPREMGLGSEADVSLADAREHAREARRLLQAGKDPIATREASQRAAQGQGVTFREVSALYIGAHADTWRNEKHRWQWNATLDAHAHPVLGSLPVTAVGVAEVMRVLDPIWREKPETASRLRGRIESVLDYASTRGWRTGENPARWKGHLANLLPARSKLAPVQHHAALPWGECPAFMLALAGQGGTAAAALRFTVLTAGRTSEVTGATWGEIDLAAKVWTVPGARMKAGREHRVPLSRAALAVLAEMHAPEAAPGDHVFPGGKPRAGLSNMAMTALLRRMGRGELTVHGFRSSFRDWCAEATRHPREVAEAALAHTIGNKVEAAYRRGDLLERRAKLMAEWAAFLARPAEAGAVVPIKRARASA